MPDNNTPPASPGQDAFGGDEEDEVFPDEDDAVEVIDLDGDDMGEESDEDGEMDENIPREDTSKLTFSKHESSVFCVDVHPQRLLVASGGEDDACYVWSFDSGDVVFKADNFKDSVAHVKFSRDGNFLAAGDLSGVIRAWRVSSAWDAAAAFEFETGGDLTWLDWHPAANVLFAGTEESEFWMWKVPSGEAKIFHGRGERVESARILADGKRAVVAYGDGSAKVFDLKSGQVLHNINGNDCAITAVDSRCDNVLVATGGQDGHVRIFNSQTGKSVACFKCSSSSSSQWTGVESLLFTPPETNQLVTGTLDGLLSIWDISSQVSRVTTKPGDGIVKMAWPNKRFDRVLVATLEGVVRVVDSRTGEVVADCSGHSAPIHDFVITSDNKTLVSCSDDGTCKTFDLEKLLT